MERRKLITEVGEMLDTYCQDCFVKEYFRKENGKRFAQTFCIKNCTVGQKLKEYGKRLS
ncbi:zinc-finger domain-containing protein [Fredinandcohnia sp. 179-A 10B2 NHS]|uniref:zinc-finger domain-containing protein n=1 Tax=Fredinandcohnia sp. 179-A 10B2 NHS TaxID=3235176 RepID=UPI0039A128EF